MFTFVRNACPERVDRRNKERNVTGNLKTQNMLRSVPYYITCLSTNTAPSFGTRFSRFCHFSPDGWLLGPWPNESVGGAPIPIWVPDHLRESIWAPTMHMYMGPRKITKLGLWKCFEGMEDMEVEGMCLFSSIDYSPII